MNARTSGKSPLVIRAHGMPTSRAPWTYEVHELSTGFSAIVYDANGQRVGTDHLSEADAALIAAAPAMYDALRKIANGTMDETYPFRAMPYGEMKKLARAALSALNTSGDAQPDAAGVVHEDFPSDAWHGG